jgi:hypothetical protein
MSVVAGDLGDALGAARRLGDEDDGLAPLTGAPQVGHPVLDAPAVLHGRLAGDVSHVRAAGRLSSDLPGSIDNCSRRVAPARRCDTVSQSSARARGSGTAAAGPRVSRRPLVTSS